LLPSEVSGSSLSATNGVDCIRRLRRSAHAYGRPSPPDKGEGGQCVKGSVLSLTATNGQLGRSFHVRGCWELDGAGHWKSFTQRLSLLPRTHSIMKLRVQHVGVLKPIADYDILNKANKHTPSFRLRRHSICIYLAKAPTRSIKCHMSIKSRKKIPLGFRDVPVFLQHPDPLSCFSFIFSMLYSILTRSNHPRL
jgi:hypothetical protein